MPAAWCGFYIVRASVYGYVVGEAPAAVDTAGISVIRLRYSAILICGFLAGLGGVYLSMAQTAQFIPNMSAGRAIWHQLRIGVW